MKITHIVYSYLGGPPSLVQSFLNQKNSKNVESAIYVGPKIFMSTLKYKRFLPDNIYHIKTIRFLSIFYFYKVLLRLIKTKPQIIVLHNYQIIPCLIYKLFFFTKIIYVDHQGFSTKTYKDRFVLEISKLFVEHYIALNRDNYNFLNTKLKINKKKISIINNGIDLKFYKPTKKKKNQKILRVGMAARLNTSRNHKLIIQAINSSLLKNIEIKCSFAGDGELMDNLKKFTKNKVTKKQFIFNGLLDQQNLKRWYSDLDLYIQSTKGEGMSISLIQAMAMGIPVLASNVTGIKTFLNPRKFIGIVFENNKISLSKKIKQFFLMKNNDKKKISNNQKLFVKNNFSKTNMIRKYNKLYKKIIKKN